MTTNGPGSVIQKPLYRKGDHMIKTRLPEFIEIGPFKVKINLLSHDLSYEVSEQQGSFHAKPPLTMHLDENIMDMHNEVSLNLLIHELFHLCQYQYQLDSTSSEEITVNAYANFMTEVLTRSNLKPWIKSVIG